MSLKWRYSYTYFHGGENLIGLNNFTELRASWVVRQPRNRIDVTAIHHTQPHDSYYMGAGIYVYVSKP
jgi:hypothetical protein